MIRMKSMTSFGKKMKNADIIFYSRWDFGLKKKYLLESAMRLKSETASA